MRFMVLLKASPETEAGGPVDTEAMDHMRDYIQELASAGVFVAAEGLQPSSRGARIIFTKQGKKSVTARCGCPRLRSLNDRGSR